MPEAPGETGRLMIWVRDRSDAGILWDSALLAEQFTIIGTTSPLSGRIVSWDHQPGTFTPVAQTERDGLLPGIRQGMASPDIGSSAAEQGAVNRQFYAIVTDLIGTPYELVAPDGSLAGHQQSTLWGDTSWSKGGASTPIRFPGQYHDAETGLHYNRHRYYDPVIGTYLTPDPLGITPTPTLMPMSQTPPS